MRIAGVLFGLLAFVAGGVVLQIFLSSKESKWPGLVLPIISFGVSLMALFGVVLFSAHTGVTTLTENGQIIEQTATQISSLSTIIATAGYVFVLYNIPTAILLAIFAACRGRHKRRRDLEKMSAQDL